MNSDHRNGAHKEFHWSKELPELPGTGDGGAGGIIGFFPLAIMQIQSWWASQFRSFHQDVPLSVVTISTQFSRPL